MISFCQGDVRLDLDILGYEFPLAREKDDANWLIVGLNARRGDLFWSAKDACLRTFELLELRDWFVQLKGKISYESKLYFTENELSFRYSSRKLTIVLDYNFLPISFDVSDDNEFLMVFDLDENKIGKIVNELSKVVLRFPIR